MGNLFKSGSHFSSTAQTFPSGIRMKLVPESPKLINSDACYKAAHPLNLQEIFLGQV